MQVIIRDVRGHIEVYSLEGSFLFSADSRHEAMRMLEED